LRVSDKNASSGQKGMDVSEVKGIREIAGIIVCAMSG
jgi:hypothetical protein